MPVRLQVSQVIDRPVAMVFRFYADHHVRNHPRWDPDIELEQVSDGPIGVGTLIRRRNRRSGTPVDGTMEVMEFERDRSMALSVRDGQAEMYGRATFEATGDDRTTLTVSAEIPGMDESMDTSRITGLMERSVRNVKHLIETEM